MAASWARSLSLRRAYSRGAPGSPSYGLKYGTAFGDTHLGKVGREAVAQTL